MGKLNVKKIENDKTTKILIDGNGLRLKRKGKSRHWVLRVQIENKISEIGLGGYPLVGLADARDKAFEIRRKIKSGILDYQQKNKKYTSISFEEASIKKFNEVKTTFKNKKHSDGWINSLKIHVFPSIGKMNIKDVQANHIIDVLEKIWVKKHDTAAKIKQRIGQIIQWSTAKHFRENSIDMKIIDQALSNYKVRPVHQKALDYKEIPDFIKKLNSNSSPTNLALKFAILTASRTIEVRSASWEQIDIKNKIWNKPPSIMKNNKGHHVPLTDEMIEVLNKAKDLQVNTNSHLIFQGNSKIKYFDVATQKEVVIDGAINENAMRNEIIKIVGKGNATTHGFRSSFADWALELYEADKKLVSRCLSHSDENKLESAYMRTDLLERRKDIMLKWNEYCSKKVK
ncbi:MAG: tyrosine-type recombinase/integrase [Caulobacterales bacterium]|nr:tyrosine-type recombinase/integrase [Caulobacterales bacterium]MCA0373730.1 tyrosine-type recombinase/integrase [Pseudomonadota bacterium]